MKTYYIGTIPVSDELYHFGILGQKWGIRRYQNKDRTLTDAGKERYRKKADKIDAKIEKNIGYKKRFEERRDVANDTQYRLKAKQAEVKNTITDLENKSKKMQASKEWGEKNLGFSFTSKAAIDRTNKKVEKFMKYLNELDYDLNKAIQDSYEYQNAVDSYIREIGRLSAKSNLYRSAADEGITIRQKQKNDRKMNKG